MNIITEIEHALDGSSAPVARTEEWKLILLSDGPAWRRFVSSEGVWGAGGWRLLRSGEVPPLEISAAANAALANAEDR